jgi:phage tail sheath protein FI
MPNYVSPGVYTIEKDISEYAPSINTSIVGVVGFAAKGPTNKATLITSQNNLIRTFGEPSEAITGQGLEGSLEILEQTNSLYYIRAAASTAADASATMGIGSCPAVIVSGPAAYGAGQGFGVDSGSSLTLRIQVYDQDGVAQYADNGAAGKDFSIPAGTATSQGEAIRKIVGGGLDADKVGCFFDGPVGSDATTLGLSGAIVGSFAGSGASIGVSSCTGTSFEEANGVSALMATWAPSGSTAGYGASGNYASAVRVYGGSVLTTGTNSAAYKVESLYPGTGYNGGTRTDGTTSGNSIGVSGLGSQNFNLLVNENGVTDEVFKASFVGSGSFIEDVINTGETNKKSDTIKGNLVKDDADVAAAKLDSFTGTLGTLLATNQFEITSRWLDPILSTDGTAAPVTLTETTIGGTGSRFNKLVPVAPTNMAGGTNGTDSSTDAASLIGDASVEPKTGMQSLDDATLNVGIALVPGIQTQSVQNALITLAETTQNFLALVSPPVAVGTTQDAIDWSNGKSSSTGGSRTAPINSSYAAIYWPWVKVFSTFDGIDRWFDPAIYGARQMAFTDSVADSWFAPAGYRRGRLTKPTEVEVKLNQGDRDSLYSGGNVVNPIVSFPQQGITIFGQRTTQRSPSALDRINVRRLMIYVRKVILAATQRFVFEPNDEFTWAQIEGVLNPFLDDIKRRRGITEFRVVCDDTVNTPLRIDRNELWTKVLIKPTKTAEILIFEINLTNQSAQLGSL